MPLIEVYARKDCALCKLQGCALCMEALSVIGKVSQDVPFQCKEVDIDSSDDLMRKYTGEIPTVFINGKKAFKYKVDEAEFRKKVRKEIIKAGIFRLSKKERYS
ncbi:MAG: hypothetical protein A2V21_301995 [Deltaproteobacteria bacterium GWC2_55_46]|nr:MAG: hypothetical protein A2Z79_06670 [Deltaproteobacteria bacterium GWA2_55_82]OGQ63303.1 MAG: hypothetical protein A3I81_00930 [Deltaproteobacteria bacterium RIFCSPLOWO2_02_FULL_55_12]OIJ73139.1 MAG: hypothetical protein A2V21_301995 [Deltaproteobacteria bacterium GWC2_55_46]